MKIRMFSLVGVIAVCFVTVSCSTDTIWGIDAETFEESIRHGDSAFLRHIDYDEVDLEEIFQLGPGSALSSAYIFDDLGMAELALDMLRLGWEEGIGLWRMHAGEELIRRLIDSRNYSAAEVDAEVFMREYDTRYFGYRQLIAARYWQHEDQEVLDLLEQLQEQFPSETAGDAELVLFAAVSSSRQELPGWDDIFVELFQTAPSSGLLIRGYKYVTGTDRIRDFFSEDELAFFNARVLTATGRTHEAAEIYTALLEGMSPVIFSEEVYEEIGAVFLDNLLYSEGSSLLLEHTAGQPFFYSRFSAGQLLRAKGEYKRAHELFVLASENAGDDRQRYERAVWYGLDCLLKQSTELFIREIPDFASRWDRPAYFSDLLEDAAAELTASRQWDRIWDLLVVLLKNDADSETIALYGHILLQAEKAGFYNIPYNAAVPDETALLGIVTGHHSYGYYQIMNLASAEAVPDALSAIYREGPGEVPQAAESREADVIRSFAAYALYRQVYRYALLYEQELSNGELLETASLLHNAGYFREAIRLLNRGMQRRSWRWTREGFEILFPKAYAHTIERAAQENRIDVQVLNALIREESYFDPEAVSHAGAIGLSQLMPATASDTARRMGMEIPDLVDPADNISLGSYYFASLLNRFNGIPLYAVCAYNAGPTRMRRWAGAFGNLPAPLLIESIPIDETRNHAKKVLVSTVLYGYLYSGQDPKTTIHYFLTGQQQ